MRVKGTTRPKRGKAAPDATAEGAPQAAPKSLDKATDNADKLAYLCAKYSATYSRTKGDDGVVRIVLHVTGEGADNDEAIAALVAQLGAE